MSDVEEDSESVGAEYISGEQADDDSMHATDEESADEFDGEAAAEAVSSEPAPSFTREIIIVKPEERRTPSVMSKFEMTEHVSIRATQIAQYNNCMVDITGLDDPVKMAKRELMMKMSPLVLRRHVGDSVLGGETTSYYEYWSPNEMTFAVSYNDVI